MNLHAGDFKMGVDKIASRNNSGESEFTFGIRFCLGKSMLGYKLVRLFCVGLLELGEFSPLLSENYALSIRLCFTAPSGAEKIILRFVDHPKLLVDRRQAILAQRRQIRLKTSISSKYHDFHAGASHDEVAFELSRWADKDRPLDLSLALRWFYHRRKKP